MEEYSADQCDDQRKDESERDEMPEGHFTGAESEIDHRPFAVAELLLCELFERVARIIVGADLRIEVKFHPRVPHPPVEIVVLRPHERLIKIPYLVENALFIQAVRDRIYVSGLF